MKWFKKLAVLSFTTAIVISAFMSTNVKGETEGHETFHYVALGDSLTVGYEPGMTEKSVPYGFVDRLYEQSLYYGVSDMKNYGILGLDSDGLKNLVAAVDEGKKVSSSDIQENLPDPRVNSMLSQLGQMKQDLEAADLITITIGGNDFPHNPTDLNKMTDEAINESLSNYSKNIDEILTLITKINPECSIYIANQYQPFSSSVDFFYTGLFSKLNKIKDGIDSNLEQVIDKYKETGNSISEVDVASAFIGNESKYTYVSEVDIHPKQAGYNTMAKSFSDAIWGSYQQPTATKPITVIFDGEQLISNYEILMIKDRTYVTLTDYTQALGIQHQWDAMTHSVSLTYNGNTVSFKNNSSEALVNGNKVALTGPVVTKDVKNNATDKIEPKMYVPLNSLATALGLDVKYMQKSVTAYINQK